MTMRNRRVVAPRKGRFWTTATTTLTLAAAAVGGASQKSFIISSVFVTNTGRNVYNVTLSRLFLRGLYHTIAIVTTPVVVGVTLGVGVFAQNIDDIDFPNLASHAGNWMLHDVRQLREREAGNAVPNPMEPTGTLAGSNVDLVGSSMRKIGNVQDVPFLVLEKDVATEEDILLKVSITALWLLPG